MIRKTYKFFNQTTRQAVFERVRGYVVKSYTKGDEIATLIKKYNLREYYRFDLGENVLGFSPRVYRLIQRFKDIPKDDLQLNNYPEVIHQRLRRRIASKHNIDQNSIVISTGLDAILDLITRVFFDPKDYYITLVPSFYLFEDYSERLGALPVFLELDENDKFAFTEAKVEELKDQIIRFKPKIVWIANPNNPTGSVIDIDVIEDIVKLAVEYNTFVVVDEAYIEFLENIKNVSAIQFADKYTNLIVLRTFSKAYGLAGNRIGYLISSSQDIVDAMLMLRTHFPVTQLALNMASIALHDEKFLIDTRIKTKVLSEKLFKDLEKLESFKYIPTNTNIFLLKNIHLKDTELDNELKNRGILTSYVNFPNRNDNQYLRITVRCEKDNMFFYKVCKEINEEFKVYMH